LISRRVRQLNAGGGGTSRPLLATSSTWGRRTSRCSKIIEEKMGWEIPELAEVPRSAGKKRRKH